MIGQSIQMHGAISSPELTERSIVKMHHVGTADMAVDILT